MGRGNQESLGKKQELGLKGRSKGFGKEERGRMIQGRKRLLLKVIQGSRANISSVGSKGSYKAEYNMRLKK